MSKKSKKSSQTIPRLSQQERRRLSRLIRAGCEEADLCITIRHGVTEDELFIWALGHQGTPLHVAAAVGNIGAVEAILNNGGAIDPPDGKLECTPLIFAARMGREEVVRLLIERHADVHARDMNGNTSIYYAAIGDSIDCCRLLISAGVPVDVRNMGGITGLFEAVRRDCSNSARFLVDAGADIDALTAENETPFSAARDKPVMRAILEKAKLERRRGKAYESAERASL